MFALTLTATRLSPTPIATTSTISIRTTNKSISTVAVGVYRGSNRISI